MPTRKSNPFIQLAYQGQNHWWRYLCGSFFALFVFLIIGGVVSVGLLLIYVMLDGDPTTLILPVTQEKGAQQIVSGVGPSVLYCFNNLPFLAFWLGIYGAVKMFHGRALRSLITPAQRISWMRIGQGFAVFFTLQLIQILANYFWAPNDFVLNFQPQAFLAFLPMVLLITPLQTTAEELFFRGYLLQGIGSHLGNWIAVVISSLLFTALHSSNPEVLSQDTWESTFSIMAYYWMVGAFLAFITLKDRSLELALGAHAANNIATLLLVTSPNSVLPSPAILSMSEITADFTTLFFTALFLLVFSLIVFRGLQRPPV
ncbi:MAG: CPBP family intramembrane metalloprotease [Phormidesmis sp. RL_2_1]|nr:CPBP family intramembrane metalloprotease [Phormidesmis sp. RL_2_1]